MTLTTLLIRIGIVSVLLTLLMFFGIIKTRRASITALITDGETDVTDHSTKLSETDKSKLAFRKPGNFLMSLLQNFCGVLFLFSGWVKAVDPLGTAYKMEQYFAEFESTFQGTWMKFIAPIFPVLSEYAIGFSVAMIVIEIILGLMLIMGMRGKLTAWAFFLLVAFFTFLTGFTYLTGYVPNGSNFFDFASWGEYQKTNMKVTDCGCFGDFIKLEPYTSFLKDVALLFPALFFLFRSKTMHKVFSNPLQTGIVGLSTLGLLVYCISNFAWDIPHADFRPFNIGKDVRTQKQIEADAQAEVKITDWKLKHNETGEELIVENGEYLGNYKKYKGVYKVVDQIKSEPSMAITKISDFTIEDADGNDLTDNILSEPGAQLLIVNYKLKGGQSVEKTRMVRDSIFKVDTVLADNKEMIVKTFDKVVERKETYDDYVWDSGYLEKHKRLKPFTDAAKSAGLPVTMAIGGADEMQILDFNTDTQLNLNYGMADDILLKTIVRSNPGVVLFKDGKILDKWHINKLPDFNSVQNQYLKR